MAGVQLECCVARLLMMQRKRLKLASQPPWMAELPRASVMLMSPDGRGSLALVKHSIGSAMGTYQIMQLIPRGLNSGDLRS